MSGGSIEAPVLEPRDVFSAGLTVAGVRKAFGATVALDAFDLTVAGGEIVAVVGPSGCGKSTLLDLVCGLSACDAGSITSPPAVLMPQRDGLLPWLRAADNAALPLRLRGVSKAVARAEAVARFDEFGLNGFASSWPRELSGGMRQRVAFVRTLLADKPVLCLDEPFAALDALTRAQAQGWLASALAVEARTVLLVTHDVEEAVLLADRVVVMSERPGRIVASVSDLPARPRVRTDPAVMAAREQVLGALGVSL